MKKFVDEVWFKNRAVVSDGYQESLNYINTRLKINQYKIKSGTKHYGWTIPKKWTLKEAYLEVDGKKFFDATRHPLNTIVGTGSVNETMPFEKLLEHIYIDNTSPLSIPYVYEHYNEERWGFCMSSHDVNSIAAALQGKEVKVVIDAVREDGDMVIGEYVKRGESPKSIALFAHLDHPAQVQDGLSGCALLVEFAQNILDNMKDNYYTYRILFFPETLGSLAYLSTFPKRTEDIKAAMCLEMVGVPNQPLVVQDAYREGTEFADAVWVAARDIARIEEPLQPHRSVVVNDDGVFNAPGIEIPTVALTRSASRDIIKSTHFNGYHTSSDDANNISWENMYESLSVVVYAINIMETNMRIKRQYDGIPQLSAHGLWVPRNQNPELNAKIKDIIDMLRTGEETVLEVAKQTGLRYQIAARYIADLEKAGLVKTRRKIEGEGRIIHV